MAVAYSSFTQNRTLRPRQDEDEQDQLKTLAGSQPAASVIGSPQTRGQTSPPPPAQQTMASTAAPSSAAGGARPPTTMQATSLSTPGGSIAPTTQAFPSGQPAFQQVGGAILPSDMSSLTPDQRQQLMGIVNRDPSDTSPIPLWASNYLNQAFIDAGRAGYVDTANTTGQGPQYVDNSGGQITPALPPLQFNTPEDIRAHAIQQFSQTPGAGSYGFHSAGRDPSAVTPQNPYGWVYEADPGFAQVTTPHGNYFVRAENAAAMQQAADAGDFGTFFNLLHQDGSIPGFNVWSTDPGTGQPTLTPWNGGTGGSGGAPTDTSGQGLPTGGAPVGQPGQGGGAGIGSGMFPTTTAVIGGTPPATPAAQPAPGGPPAGGGAQGPNWYDQLWQLTQNAPQFQSVDPGRSTEEQAILSDLYGRTTAPVPQMSFGSIDATMPEATSNLDAASAALAMQMLETPGRYDTDLFNNLMQSAFGELDKLQQRDMLDLRRDSLQRLGTNSGQLTNEYIDLADEYDRRRTDRTLSLLREAALTNAQDNLAALSAGRGVSGDIFGREQSLRDEGRYERGFARETDQLNYGRQQDAMDRLSNLSNQIFTQNQALRSESRAERQAAMDNYAQQIDQMMQFGMIDRQLGRDAMDDYFRWVEAERAGNETLARLMQQEFINAIALSQLVANLPGALNGGGGTGGGGGGGSYNWQDNWPPPNNPDDPANGGNNNGNIFDDPGGSTNPLGIRVFNPVTGRYEVM